MAQAAGKFSHVDWNACGSHVFGKLPHVLHSVAHLTSRHPECRFSWQLSKYPPAIVLYFWFPEPAKCRRKVSGVEFNHISPPDIYLQGPTRMQVIADLRDEELNLVSEIVSKVSGELVAKRIWDSSQKGLLEYKLTADYKDFPS